jgi:hypothetical protein
MEILQIYMILAGALVFWCTGDWRTGDWRTGDQYENS